MDAVLTTFGWASLVFCLIGLFASALSAAYYFGYKKGGGEWKGTDLFAPKPLRLPYDAEIVTEVKILRNKLLAERNEVLRLRKQVEKQYAELHNGKQMPAPRKRKPTLTTRNIYVP
jgi:hypothetical protein